MMTVLFEMTHLHCKEGRYRYAHLDTERAWEEEELSAVGAARVCSWRGSSLPKFFLTPPSLCLAHEALAHEALEITGNYSKASCFLWLIVAALRPFSKSKAHLRLAYHTAVAALSPTALVLSHRPSARAAEIELSPVTPLDT